MTTMAIRCDEKDKREATKVAEYYGFDLSFVTCAFWTQMGRTGRIPLDLSNEEPSGESLRSIFEAEDILAAGGTGESFDSGRTLLDAARAWPLEDSRLSSPPCSSVISSRLTGSTPTTEQYAMQPKMPSSQ